MAVIPSPFATTPGGAAGGDLSGTYPSPTVKSAAGNFAVTGNETVGGTANVSGELVAHTQETFLGAGTPSTPGGTAVKLFCNNGAGLILLDNNGAQWPVLAGIPHNAFPAGALAETAPRFALNSVAVGIGATTGTVYMAAFWAPMGVTLTHVNFVTGSTAANTPTHWWAGYADSAGVQRAHTADQLTAAVAANTAFSVALAANYTTTANGIYYALLSMTATANATLTGVSAVTNSSKVSPVLAGVSASAAQSTPGTDGTTTYSLPTGDNALGYFYAT